MNKINAILFRLIFAVFSSLLFAGLSFFQWSIIDYITPFLLVPLWIIVGFVFFVSLITSMSCFLAYKKIKHYSLIPISVNIATLLIPYTSMWVTINYYRYKACREEIVEKVLQGQLKPNIKDNPSLISLGKSYPCVSTGGNEIVVEEKNGGKYLLFFTFRGILDHYSGFIYVPDGGKPEMYGDLDESKSTEIYNYDHNWYWVSHR